MVIRFKTGNAAFTGDSYGFEVARILSDISVKVMDGHRSGKIYDVNGNPVGDWKENQKNH